jgi:mRNA interferase MazF
MTSYEFGEIVLVPFPFTDQTAAKKRPAVVVSSPAYNRQRADIILVAITSQVRASPTVGEVPITKWKEAGLAVPGVIKPVISTLKKQLVIKKLGRLEGEDRQAMLQVLRTILGE